MGRLPDHESFWESLALLVGNKSNVGPRKGVFVDDLIAGKFIEGHRKFMDLNLQFLIHLYIFISDNDSHILYN